MRSLCQRAQPRRSKGEELSSARVGMGAWAHAEHLTPCTPCPCSLHPLPTEAP